MVERNLSIETRVNPYLKNKQLLLTQPVGVGEEMVTLIIIRCLQSSEHVFLVLSYLHNLIRHYRALQDHQLRQD